MYIEVRMAWVINNVENGFSGMSACLQKYDYKMPQASNLDLNFD